MTFKEEIREIVEEATVEWNNQVGPQGSPAVLVDQETWVRLLDKLKLPHAGGSFYNKKP